MGLRGGAYPHLLPDQQVVNPAWLTLLAYGIGATPTSYWVGKGIYGIDLRTKGSNNLGATNTFRILGWKAALPVVFFDVAKGWFVVSMFPQWQAGGVWEWTLAFAAAAIVGHMFSFWVTFKGGKGVATSAGAFIGLAPWAVLIAFVVWLAVAFTTRYVSLASILAMAVAPIGVYFTPHQGGNTVLWFTVALASLVVWAHRSNLGRLLRGEENRFGARKQAAAEAGS